MNTKKLLLVLGALFTSGAAHAQTVSLAQDLKAPFTLYSCEALNYQEASRPDLAMLSLYVAGHRAHFEILRAASASTIFVRANYSYEQRGSRDVMNAYQMLFLMNARALNTEYPGYLERNGITNREIRAKLENHEAYINFPDLPAFPKEVFNQYLLFPKGPYSVDGQAVPVQVKITQESTFSPPGFAEAAWSKLYYAECKSTELSQEEFEAQRRAMVGELKIVRADSVQRDLLVYPALQAALRVAPLYSNAGEYLAGQAGTAAKVGAGIAAATAVARLAITAFFKNPAAAAYFLPTESAPLLRLDLNGTELSAEEARRFLGSSPAEQRAACESAPGYRALCARLDALEAQLSQGPVL